MTYLVIVAFVAILGSLVAAMLFMLRRPGAQTQEVGHDLSADEANVQRSRRMARALAFRVGFSILLFTLILFSHWMGWIQPTGIAAGQ